MTTTLKPGEQLSRGNWTIERLTEDTYELHYLGNGWQSKTVTRQQVAKANTFFELFNN